MNRMSKSKLWQIMAHCVSGLKVIKTTTSNQPCGRNSEYIIGVFLKSFSIDSEHFDKKKDALEDIFQGQYW